MDVNDVYTHYSKSPSDDDDNLFKRYTTRKFTNLLNKIDNVYEGEILQVIQKARQYLKEMEAKYRPNESSSIVYYPDKSDIMIDEDYFIRENFIQDFKFTMEYNINKKTNLD